MLTTYLLIGLVVQIITTVERVIRGVVNLDGVFDTLSNISIFIIIHQQILILRIMFK